MEVEMNGNLSNSSTNSNYNGFESNTVGCGTDSGGPLTSTPISDRSIDGEVEQPTSTSYIENGGGGGGMTAPKYGTLIPNRVFVGGISCQTSESELMQLFSKFGAIRGTKIIMDRAGVSKGYGFVTFETEDEAKRLLNAMNHREMAPIVHRDRRLNIAPAVKKQPMMQRQNVTYGSQGSIGASSTFSPPPFDSYYYAPGQSPQGEFFVPPVPIQDNYFQQQTHGFSNGGFSNGISNALSTGLTNGYSNGGLANGYSSTTQVTDGMGQFYTVPNLGMGQAIQGPNGSIIFVPMPSMPSMPQCQQLNSVNWIV
ncbi:DAZ protein 1 isoform X2 [Folsomia candida]|uniref:DAZ protein 1 isoform X2 n=1 Tax=Folsomia candida TaxID=158441 RepID=UPI000B8F67FB|nr:DAZ protein 1 isoform X2 [Folsomia candida]